MPLPANSTLSLQGYSKPGDSSYSKPKQAMIVRMSEEMLASLENTSKLEFEFGENNVRLSSSPPSPFISVSLRSLRH